VARKLRPYHNKDKSKIILQFKNNPKTKEKQNSGMAAVKNNSWIL
jgi:hypothetical protein